MKRVDLYHIDLNPTEGREQAGARFVLELSPRLSSTRWGLRWFARSRKAAISHGMRGLRFR